MESILLINDYTYDVQDACTYSVYLNGETHIGVYILLNRVKDQ